MQNLLLILRLIWLPRSLAKVAIVTSNILVIPISAAVIALEIATIIAAAVGGMDEPFIDIWAYLRECGGLSIQAFAGLSLIFAPWVILFVAIFKDKSRSRWAAESRAIILAPLCFMLPVLVWSVSIMFAQIDDPSFGVGKIAPNWVVSPVFQFLGSPLWLLIMVVAGVVVCDRAAREVRRTFPVGDPSNCEECGYFLKGLPERRCPECGKAF